MHLKQNLILMCRLLCLYIKLISVVCQLLAKGAARSTYQPPVHASDVIMRMLALLFRSSSDFRTNKAFHREPTE